MERKFNKGDIVQHFKREKMTEEQLKEVNGASLGIVVDNSHDMELENLKISGDPDEPDSNEPDAQRIWIN